MSRATDYLRSLTSHSISQVNFYKLGQIAGYIEGLEGALKNYVEIDDWANEQARARGDHVPASPLRARVDAALTEPDV